MPRIIKPGRLPSAQVATATCGRCHGVAEYERKDVTRDQRDGDYVVCPSCGSFIAAATLTWHDPEPSPAVTMPNDDDCYTREERIALNTRYVTSD